MGQNCFPIQRSDKKTVKENPLVSIIIPAYNEEASIGDCLNSLVSQSYRPREIIVVDDGSFDKTKNVVQKFGKVKLLTQNHQGPGPARNLGAKHARGEILVFVDADMTFDKNFLKELTKPIRDGKVIGTFSKEEFVVNKDNVWARCWSINRGWSEDRMHPSDYPEEQEVFRAILKKEFDKVGGFDPIGYTDDWTLSRKLGVKAKAAQGAIFYHRNPKDFVEIWSQARWIGKNEFIAGSFVRQIWSLWVYGFPNSLFKAVRTAIFKKRPEFLIFKPFYDLAIFISVLKAFLGEQKAK